MRKLVAAVAAVTMLVGGQVAAGAETASSDVCPDRLPSAGFDDVYEGSTHARAVDCLVWWSVTKGVTADLYDPDGVVTRGQMATFLARTVAESGHRLRMCERADWSIEDGCGDRFAFEFVPHHVPVAGTSASSIGHEYADVATSHPHRAGVVTARWRGIAGGYSDGTYRPGASVTRAQMATFLVRTWQSESGSALPDAADAFDDDDGDSHEQMINVAAHLGLAGGVGERTYAPSVTVTRAQMATFLVRLLGLLTSAGERTDAGSGEEGVYCGDTPEGCPDGSGGDTTSGGGGTNDDPDGDGWATDDIWFDNSTGLSGTWGIVADGHPQVWSVRLRLVRDTVGPDDTFTFDLSALEDAGVPFADAAVEGCVGYRDQDWTTHSDCTPVAVSSGKAAWSPQAPVEATSDIEVELSVSGLVAPASAAGEFPLVVSHDPSGHTETFPAWVGAVADVTFSDVRPGDTHQTVSFTVVGDMRQVVSLTVYRPTRDYYMGYTAGARVVSGSGQVESWNPDTLVDGRIDYWFEGGASDPGGTRVVIEVPLHFEQEPSSVQTWDTIGVKRGKRDVRDDASFTVG